jgi:uncharacterized membrane protein YdjX (TVP38/TMEM64 family)
MKLTALFHDRRFWLVLAAIGAIAGLRLSGLGDVLSLETIKTHRQTLAAFVQDNFVPAVLAYAVIYIAAVAFSVPGAAILSLAGGFLFGAATGTLLTTVSATAGATLVFLFARLIFGDAALERLGPQAKNLAANIQQNAWSYLLVLRLVPLFPFFFVNLIPAFAGVRFSTYVLTTLFGILPGTLVFSLSGAGLGRVLDKGGELSAGSIFTPEIIAALTGLALLSLAAIPLRKYFERRNAA